MDTFGTGSADDAAIERAVREVFGLTPEEIIARFDLRRPIYEDTAKGGHFGHETPGFPWESTDRVEALVAAVGR